MKLEPMSWSGMSAQAIEKRPCGSVVTSRPLTVASLHARQARLALILVAVAVLVVEDLADHVGAVEHRLLEDGDAGPRRGEHLAGAGIDQLRAVHIVAGGGSRGGHERELDLMSSSSSGVSPSKVRLRPSIEGSTADAVHPWRCPAR